MSWDQQKLGSLVLQRKGAFVSGPFGSNISAKYFVDEGVPVIRGNNLTKGGMKFIDEGFAFVTASKAQEFSGCMATEDDIILTAAGSIGQVGIIPRERQHSYYIISNKQLRARIDPARANPLFVYYWLSSRRMVTWLERMNNGGAVPLLNLAIVRNAPVPCPSLKTQARVCSILSAYDDLIENNRRRIRLLEQSARLLYEEWFVRLRFPGHENATVIDGVPEGWEVKALGDIAHTNRENYRAEGLPGQINYIDISSVTKGRITGKAKMASINAPGRARRKARSGDVIWSNVRPNLRAYALVLEPDENDVVSTGFTVLTPSDVPYSYLYLLVTAERFVGHLENRATGVSYPAVRAQDFEQARVVCPTGHVLELFHKSVEPMFRCMSILERQVCRLQEARDLPLSRLMNGEITVL